MRFGIGVKYNLDYSEAMDRLSKSKVLNHLNQEQRERVLKESGRWITEYVQDKDDPDKEVVVTRPYFQFSHVVGRASYLFGVSCITCGDIHSNSLKNKYYGYLLIQLAEDLMGTDISPICSKCDRALYKTEIDLTHVNKEYVFNLWLNKRLERLITVKKTVKVV